MDFVVATGTSKLTRVRQIKRNSEEKYEIWKDHWKILRDGIAEYHATGKGNKDEFFDALLAKLTKEEKRKTYAPLVVNYKKILGRKTFVSAPPDRHITWKHNDLEVRVNPELRLTVNDTESVIKLYFKKDVLAKNRVAIIQLLMKHALPASPGPVNYCLLDVSHGKTYSDANPNDDILPLLLGEADSFLTMWKTMGFDD